MTRPAAAEASSRPTVRRTAVDSFIDLARGVRGVWQFTLVGPVVEIVAANGHRHAQGLGPVRPHPGGHAAR